jgi:hypothetical protein
MDFRQRPEKAAESSKPLFDSATFKESFGRDPQRSRRRSSTGPLLNPVRRPRSPALIAAVRRLDVTVDEMAAKELAGWIRDEYHREFGADDVPLGFVAVCYLGPPRVEHRLDLTHTIVGHFSAAQAMPEPFQGCRMLVRSGIYEYVEVYLSGQVIPIHADGTPILPANRGGQS